MNVNLRRHASHATGSGEANDELLRAYLVDLQGHELLSGEQQLAIARSIRVHRTKYRETVLSQGVAQRRFLSLFRALQKRDHSIQEICEISFRDQVQHQMITRQISKTADLLEVNLASSDRAMNSVMHDDAAPGRIRTLAGGIARRLDACAHLLERIPFRQACVDQVYDGAVELSHSMQTHLQAIRPLARQFRPEAEPIMRKLRLEVKEALTTPSQLAVRLDHAAYHKTKFEEHVRELARANLRLVVKVAKQYRNRGLSFLDLIQEGNAGLMQSLARLDERFGCRVSSYAMWWIRQSIIKALQRHGRHVRLPIAAGHLAAQFMANADRIHRETGSRPSAERLANDAGVSTNVAEAILRAAERPLSLDVALDNEHGARVSDILQDNRETDARSVMELSEVLQGAVDGLERLSQRERDLLKLRYGLDDGEFHSFRELSSIFSLTPQRLQQIEHRALRKLRSLLERGGY